MRDLVCSAFFVIVRLFARQIDLLCAKIGGHEADPLGLYDVERSRMCVMRCVLLLVEAEM